MRDLVPLSLHPLYPVLGVCASLLARFPPFPPTTPTIAVMMHNSHNFGKRGRAVRIAGALLLFCPLLGCRLACNWSIWRGIGRMGDFTCEPLSPRRYKMTKHEQLGLCACMHAGCATVCYTLVALYAATSLSLPPPLPPRSGTQIIVLCHINHCHIWRPDDAV